VNEPKKRGRPSKAEIAMRELAEGKPRVDLTPEVKADEAGFDRAPCDVATMTRLMVEDGDRIQKAKFATFSAPAENVRKLDPNEPIQIYVDPLTTKLAQLYAERIWNGQSPSAMDTKERIQRVREALQGQGLPCDGVELPGGFKL
jgi:hypothetical protein